MMKLKKDEIYFMQRAIQEAKKAIATGDIPVGAVTVVGGKMIARAHNEKEVYQDATAHAELLCLKRTAKKLKRWRLQDVTLFSTLEPCAMCAGAMVQARIGRLVYGVADQKAGAAGSVINLLQHDKLNHRVKLTQGILAPESKMLLQSFFQALRMAKRSVN